MTDEEKIAAVKAELSKYRAADREIDCQLLEIKHLRSLATRVSQTFSGMPGRQGPGDTVGGAVVKLVDMEREVDRRIDELQEVKRRVVELIGMASTELYRDLLTRRYICGQSWEDIARALFFEMRWTFETHRKALLDLSPIL